MSLNVKRFVLGIAGSFLLVSPLLAQRGQVSGEVLDPDGKPIKDVLIRIMALSSSKVYKVKTDKKGRYFHGSVNIQDRYRVVAEKEGYTPQFVTGLVPSWGGEQSRGILDFVLRPGPRGYLDFELTDEEREEFKRQEEEQIQQQKVAAELSGYFGVGVKAFNAKDYEGALSSFRQALQLNPENGDIWGNIAACYFSLTEYDEAIKAYETAIKYKTKKTNLYKQLGNVYSRKGDQEKAIEYWEKAASVGVEGDPEEAAISYFNLGATYTNAGQNIGAIEAFQKAIKHNPEHSEAHYQLGVTLVGINQMEDGITHLKRYLKLSPNGSNAEVAKALIEQLDQ